MQTPRSQPLIALSFARVLLVTCLARDCLAMEAGMEDWRSTCHAEPKWLQMPDVHEPALI
eukprot:700623-Lingulodinium_polyedra.AAC.1